MMHPLFQGTLGRRHQGSPRNQSPMPQVPAPLGSHLQEALLPPTPAAPRGPRQAAVPSQSNLIAFPRLQSITPRRRQN